MKYTKQSILFIAALLLLISLSNCTETVELRDSNAGTTSNTIQFALSLEASPNDIVGVTTTTRAAVVDDYNDPNADPYIHSLWVVIFNSDGSRYAEPKNIFNKLSGNSVLYWTYPHDLNYDEEQHVYFITNVEDAGILSQLQAVQDEAEMKALKWGLTSAGITDPKELYTRGKYPKVRMLVASYAVGVQSENAGGKIYYKRLAPVGFEDTTERYATETTTHDALIQINLVRTYSSIKVEMQQDKDLSKVYHELYDIEGLPGVFTTFSFTGYAKEYSIFGKTEKPAETAVLPTVEYPIKLIGKDPDVEWDEDYKGALHFYFPSTSQEEKEEEIEVQKFNSNGQVIDHIVKYKVPCLDISYNHRGKPHHIFVNSKDGEVFKPNYNYKLPITFYPPTNNIWIVALRNILTSEIDDITIEKVQAETWEARTFANELHYGEQKAYEIPSAGAGKKMYSTASVYYGNIHDYSTVIETVSLGAPAVVADKEKLPKWIKNIEEKEFRTFNDGSLLLYVQLWVLTPKELQDNNTRLRGAITFRNKIKDVDPSLSEEEKAKDDVRVNTTFNILTRFANINLGNLNTFANGKTLEYDPVSNQPLYSEADEGRKGLQYQFGRNIPLDTKKLSGSNVKSYSEIDLKTTNQQALNKIQYVWNSNAVLGLTVYSWWRYGKPTEKILDPAFENNPWSWIVNKTYELYHNAPGVGSTYPALTKAYVGNNGGDPCPGGKGNYDYYKIPRAADMAAIFYNKHLVGRNKYIALPSLKNNISEEVNEEGVNPGGNPGSTDVGKKFKAFYHRKGTTVYAVRFIGTKWESFFVYESTTRGGSKGLLVTSAVTPEGLSEAELKDIVRNGTVKQKIVDKEKCERFFPYSPLFIVYNGTTFWGVDGEDDAYSDYHTNTTIFDTSTKEYMVFDIDIQGDYNDEEREMVANAAGLNIRCIRK